VYHTTYPNVAGLDWDVYLLTDVAGRVLRFPAEETLTGALHPSAWMSDRDPPDSEAASRLKWTVAPLLRQLASLAGTSWRLCWFRHDGESPTCIVQIRVPRPNALPEAIHYTAEPEGTALGAGMQV
jgi:hypothetical protein